MTPATAVGVMSRFALLVRLDRQTSGMTDTLTPEASAVAAEIQPFLADPRWSDAPRQLRDAFVALTNGAPFTGCLRVEELPDDKLKWRVVAVAQGSIIHIEAIGPRKPERFVAYHPLTVDVQTAAVYPRSALGSVRALRPRACLRSGMGIPL